VLNISEYTEKSNPAIGITLDNTLNMVTFNIYLLFMKTAGGHV